MSNQIQDRNVVATNGYVALTIAVIFLIVFILSIIGFFMKGAIALPFAVVSFIVMLILFNGVAVIEPNKVIVLQFFGEYSGTVRNVGLVFINPLMSKSYVSTKQQNFSNHPLKVNDKKGNPIDLSAMFAWRVKDAAKAVFVTDNYNNFIQNQVEGILAEVAAKYSFDSDNDEEIVFRKNITAIAEDLKNMLQERVDECGLEIVDVRFNHFAYAVEIAAAMLRKQQAEAMLEGRKKIVEGAHKMVEDYFSRVAQDKTMVLTNEDKVAMATNLMTVLVSNSEPQPVVNLK